MKKILIAEDHADIRKLIRMTLEFSGYELSETADGVTALGLVQSIRPDLVLLDVMMPGELDGLQVCRLIKDDEQLRHVRVVLLTARGQVRDREAGVAAGADAYLVKPFSPMELLQTIEHWLKAA